MGRLAVDATARSVPNQDARFDVTLTTLIEEGLKLFLATEAQASTLARSVTK
jgi:hypothetical protein